MKGAKKITALLAAAAVALSMQVSVYAEFVDPAVTYSQYTAGKYNSNESDESREFDEQTEEDSGLIEDDLEFKADEESEEPEEPNEQPSAENDEQPEKKSEKKSDVKKPAEELTVYSFKSVVYAGDTFKIGYKLKPSKSDDTVKFISSNSKIASVDSEGNVTAKKKGGVIITAKASSGVKDVFSLTVKEAEKVEETEDETVTDNTADAEEDKNEKTESGSVKASSIELKHSSVTIYEGETYQIKYELFPSKSTDKVTYRAVNSSVASVSSDGVVTAKKFGNTRIVCTAGSGVYTKLSVTVLPIMTEEQEKESIESEIEKEYNEKGELVPSEVRFGSESVAIRVGEKLSLDARVYPSGCVYKYSIGSDNSKVAKVNGRREVTGISPGNAVITITTDNGKTDSVYITVYDGVIKGIDVSKWNGDINWAKVNKTGMADFVMIRASYGYEDTDPKLDDNVRGCEKYNIPYGFYHYLYAKNVSEAKKEAAYFLNAIAPYSPTYPVVLDIEEDFYKNMSKAEVTKIVTTFMETLEDAGYYAMIYSYAKFFDDNLNMNKLKDYDIWVACWGDEEKLSESYSYHYGMWQYSETGTIAGIDEDVDLNYCYKDYRSTILKYGLNNL